jgi:hypothetical protein
LLGGGEVGGILGEGQLTGPRAVGRREAGELDRAVAGDFPVELFGNLSSSEGHGTCEG